MHYNLKHLVRSRWTFLAAGLVLGVLLLLTFRFATYSPESVHYHSNFAVYLNGTRDTFSKPKYYEEVTICSLDGSIATPEQRVHLHDQDNSVLHIHDHAVTYGQFFANLGWSVGAGFIKTDDGTIYTDSASAKVNVLINGEKLLDSSLLANRVIQDRDRLLLSYGSEDAASLMEQYKSVPSTAQKFDTEKDPASCGSEVAPTFDMRLKHLF